MRAPHAHTRSSAPCIVSRLSHLPASLKVVSVLIRYSELRAWRSGKVHSGSVLRSARHIFRTAAFVACKFRGANFSVVVKEQLGAAGKSHVGAGHAWYESLRATRSYPLYLALPSTYLTKFSFFLFARMISRTMISCVLQKLVK